MGRHSDPDPRWFWQSLATALGKVALALVVVVVIGAGVLRWTADDGEAEQPAAAPTSSAPATSAPAGTAPSPTATPSEPADRVDTSPTESDDDAQVDATVQVLNGSGRADALDEVIAVLEDLGYTVVASGPSARRYDRTTVFWSDGSWAKAQQLRRADGRFGTLTANDRLDDDIELHVVIGADWEPAE